MPPQQDAAAPPFEGLYCDGETFRTRSLDDIAGDRGTVLVFGGFVFSAVATNWWTRYENAGWANFEDVTVVGVHRDGPYAVNAFLRSDDRPFAIFADIEGSIAAAYDLLEHRDGMAGVRTARRAIYVVNADRRITDSWVATDWISPAPRSRIEAAVASL
ncbi:MAG: redoxin domain-containing protein [Salinirussus sp.]